ncbi:MAG: hypothetical protein O7D34_05260 [Ignavibacteria bacterium]|nr:hypothetical protein [Ignavibacteria bacterium]
MPLEMKYFVLKPRGNNVHAAASRKAMRAYASHIEEEDSELGKDLRAWAHSESAMALEDEAMKIRSKY